MNSEHLHFSRVNQLLKPVTPNSVVNQIESDTSLKIKEYLDTLSIDKRKIAVGGDFYIWYHDLMSRDNLVHKKTEGFRYGDGLQESLFLIKKPINTLLSSVSWNVNFARIAATRSNVTFTNNYHLDLIEHVVLDQEELNSWNYNVISKQDIEAGEGGPFDFIVVPAWEMVHDPSLVLSYYNLLASNGLLLISWANDNGNLYKVDSQYSPYYEIIQHLKELEDVAIYHDFTTLGSAYIVKL